MNTFSRLLLSGITCFVLTSGGCDKSKEDPAPQSCSTPLDFFASMDGNGSILVSGASGGTGPYAYAVTNQNYQSSEYFAGPYADGSYVISVRSANGCETSKLLPLKRSNSGCLSAQRLQLLTNGSTKRWRFINQAGFTSTNVPRHNQLTSGAPIYFYFNTLGQYTFDDYSAVAGPNGDTWALKSPAQQITLDFCSGSQFMFHRTPGVVIVELTATKLVLRADQPNQYSIFNFEAQ